MMDVESLAKQLILQNMTPEQQMAVLDGIKASIAQAKEVQKRKIGENVDLVVQALKKIEADIRERYDEVGNAIEKRVASIKDGRDGIDGRNGRDGKDGKPGKDGAVGRPGRDGKDGKDGRDGIDGISVISANIDFDGSLIIKLSNGKEINVGEVVPMDLAERIKIIGNGGGTSQTVLDTLDSLQTQINNLIPSQTGNSGKYLTTNGTTLSWASIAGGGLSYQGTWNASTNTPTLASGTGTNGYYYVVGTSGSTNLDGITDWVAGDWLLFNGTVWQKIDQTNLVTSVNGQTGAVSLTTSNISEGSNLYYTDARVRSALSAGTGISYNSTTGAITNSAPDQTVALTGSGTVSISGTYPNFTITGADQYQGTVTSVSGTSPIASTGGTAPVISLSSGYGDTQNPYGSKTANYVLAAPNGTSGVPTFRALTAADIPSLSYVTSVSMTVPTGLSVSGTPITSSGTLAITFASGYSIPTNTSQTNWDTAYTDRLKWDGGSTGLDAATGRTSLGLGTIATQAASNVSITGGSITGITDLAIADGGTGASTATAAFNNLAPSQTSNSGKYLTTNGTNASWGSVNDAKAWVNFNGTGTVAIRASYNVSSITDNGTGDYTVNFTTALADANYSYNVSASLTYGVANFYSPALNIAKATGTEVAPTSSACRFGFTNTTPADYDPKYVNVVVFR
jgi:hypothetical protein